MDQLRQFSQDCSGCCDYLGLDTEKTTMDQLTILLTAAMATKQALNEAKLTTRRQIRTTDTLVDKQVQALDKYIAAADQRIEAVTINEKADSGLKYPNLEDGYQFFVDQISCCKYENACRGGQNWFQDWFTSLVLILCNSGYLVKFAMDSEGPTCTFNPKLEDVVEQQLVCVLRSKILPRSHDSRGTGNYTNYVKLTTMRYIATVRDLFRKIYLSDREYDFFDNWLINKGSRYP